MLLGKRPRRPMRRTTSMTEFAPDLDLMITDHVDAPQTSDPHPAPMISDWHNSRGDHAAAAAAGFLSPRGSNHRRSSGDFRAVETAAFLKACGLCNHRLGPGRDIYIYRGEVAFCSLECRQQLINQEERKEKCALASVKAESAAAASTTTSETSGNGPETVAAT